MTEKKYRFSQNYLYHAIFGRLRLSSFFSDNDIWKADFISVKTGCIIIHKEIFLSCSSCRIATNHFLLREEYMQYVLAGENNVF